MSSLAERPAATRSALLDGAPLLGVALTSTGALIVAGLTDIGRGVVLTAASALLIATVWLALRRRQPDVPAEATDPVTGLGTTTQLVSELDRRLGGPGPAPTLLLLFDLHGFKAYNDDFGRDAGDLLLARLAERLAIVAGTNGSAFRLAGDELALVVPIGEGDGERVIDAAVDALSMHGEAFRIGCSFGGAIVPYEAADGPAAIDLAERRLASQRRSRLRARAMNTLAEALSRHPEASPLTRPVESLAMAVGGLLGLTGNRLEALARAAELHDIGQLSIPSEILDKRGTLDEGEWEFVRQQTLVAEHVLHSSPHLWGVAPIVRATYENWDGTGYPDGLTGEDIPLAARIIRVCHAYDAMVSTRAYRSALDPAEALAEIESRAGTSFDPAVVNVLAALVGARSAGMRAA